MLQWLWHIYAKRFTLNCTTVSMPVKATEKYASRSSLEDYIHSLLSVHKGEQNGGHHSQAIYNIILSWLIKINCLIDSSNTLSLNKLCDFISPLSKKQLVNVKCWAQNWKIKRKLTASGWKSTEAQLNLHANRQISLGGSTIYQMGGQTAFNRWSLFSSA